MNLPNKITISRIIISIIILLLLVFPFYQIGVYLPTFVVAGRIVVQLKYIICGFLFIFASITDIVDGYIARKNKQVTDFGKVMDAIADKMLVNGVLIALGSDGFLPVIIPVIVITRDIIVDAVKMVASQKAHAIGASKLGKIKTICMLIGISFTLFYNLPFELIGIKLGLGLIYLATMLSVISGIDYYNKYKKYFS